MHAHTYTHTEHQQVPFNSKKYFNDPWLLQGFSFSEHPDLR